jgi:hypothetical protein
MPCNNFPVLSKKVKKNMYFFRYLYMFSKMTAVKNHKGKNPMVEIESCLCVAIYQIYSDVNILLINVWC